MKLDPKFVRPNICRAQSFPNPIFVGPEICRTRDFVGAASCRTQKLSDPEGAVFIRRDFIRTSWILFSRPISCCSIAHTLYNLYCYLNKVQYEKSVISVMLNLRGFFFSLFCGFLSFWYRGLIRALKLALKDLASLELTNEEEVSSVLFFLSIMKLGRIKYLGLFLETIPFTNSISETRCDKTKNVYIF